MLTSTVSRLCLTTSAATTRYQRWAYGIPVRASFTVSRPTPPAWALVPQVPVLMNEPGLVKNTQSETAATGVCC